VSTPALALALVAFALAVAGCAAAPSPTSGGNPSVTIELAADRMAFDRPTLTVPAGAAFAIRFENREVVPHNVAIRGGPGRMAGDIFSGPATRTHDFPALPAGNYQFVCDLHPEMSGVLEVTPEEGA
jgi:plastocyanin